LSGSVSKETFCPSSSPGRPEVCTAEIWTKTSFWPSSGLMKPKPLAWLKNFTVPVCGMGYLLGLPHWHFHRARRRGLSIVHLGEKKQSASCGVRVRPHPASPAAPGALVWLARDLAIPVSGPANARTHRFSPIFDVGASETLIVA